MVLQLTVVHRFGIEIKRRNETVLPLRRLVVVRNSYRSASRCYFFVVSSEWLH